MQDMILLLAVGALILLGEARADELSNPVEVCSANGICDVELDAVVKTQPFPAAGTQYSLRSPVYVLRRANGKDVQPKADDNCLVGPTLRVKPGDLLRIRIKNCFDPSLLPGDPQDAPEDYPQEFYITNLHTHGLHISPSGRADNVFVNILPGEHHQYEYRIPQNHPRGTFWYHPHRHGSVALQLTSGMAGALIVDGDGETLWKGADKPAERLFVLQQIHGTAAGNVLSVSPGDIYDKIKSANAANAGAVVPQKSLRVLRGEHQRQRAAAEKKGAPKATSSVDPCADDPPIPPSANQTEWLVVDGQNPQCRTISMHPGEIQRWRFVHAGIDEVINIVVRQTDKDGKIQQVPFHEIAVDGVPRGRAVKTYQRYLYPAYRSDVLFKAPTDLPKDSKLELWSEVAPAPVTLNGGDTTAQRIASIQLDDAKKDMNLPDDGALAGCVPVEFRGAISDTEIDGRRWALRFNFPAAHPSRFTINGNEYAMDRIDRHVKLGTAEEWLLKSDSGSSNNAGHPFHIHVNPFLHYVYSQALLLQGMPPGISINRQTLLTQLGFNVTDTVAFTGTLPSGDAFGSKTAVTEKTTLADLARDLLTALNPKVADGYRIEFVQNSVVVCPFLSGLDGLKIDQTCAPGSQGLCFAPAARQLVDLIWRDTLMAPSSGAGEVVRMRFRDFPGDTVLHCHIVDHEDQGMMMNVRIHPASPPGPDAGEKRRVESTPAMSAAPDFSLPDATGKVHRLAELVEKPTVLIFLRGKACIHCNRQLNSFARLRDRFAASGANLVAVSSTGAEGLPRARGPAPAEESFPFLLLADATREAFKRYGCIDASDSPLHGTFVLDRQGKVRFSTIGMEPFMDVERVLAEVARPGS